MNIDSSSIFTIRTIDRRRFWVDTIYEVIESTYTGDIIRVKSGEDG
ncbi:MAG: hypothetical protein AB1414_21505 [bacterium]